MWIVKSRRFMRKLQPARGFPLVQLAQTIRHVGQILFEHSSLSSLNLFCHCVAKIGESARAGEKCWHWYLNKWDFGQYDADGVSQLNIWMSSYWRYHVECCAAEWRSHPATTYPSHDSQQWASFHEPVNFWSNSNGKQASNDICVTNDYTLSQN